MKVFGPIEITTIPIVGLSPIFATFSSFSAAIFEISIRAAVGTALKPANSGGEEFVSDILSKSMRTKDSAFSRVRRFNTMDLAPVLRKTCEKQSPATTNAHKRRKGDLWTSKDSSANAVKQKKEIIAPNPTQLYLTLKGYLQL